MLDSIVFRICGIFAGIVIATSSASADETRNPLRDPPRDENVLRPSEDAQQPAASNAPLRLSFPSSPPVQAIATDVPDDELQLTGAQAMSQRAAPRARTTPPNRLRPAPAGEVRLQPLPSSRRAGRSRVAVEPDASDDPIAPSIVSDPADDADVIEPEVVESAVPLLAPEADALESSPELADESPTFEPRSAFSSSDTTPLGPDTTEEPEVADDLATDLAPQVALGAPAAFRGIVPGESTDDDVRAAWGEPESRNDQAGLIRATYKLEPYEKVEVTFQQRKALSIVAMLRRAIEADALAKELELDPSTAISFRDEIGRNAGELYPEHGVTFHFAAAGGRKPVIEAWFEPLNPVHFVIRAEDKLSRDYADCLADLDAALEIDPMNAAAHGLRATVLFEIGRRDEALAACRKAIEYDSENPQFYLTQAAVLADLGEYEAALTSTKQALDRSKEWPETHARGLNQLADHLALGPARDYPQALKFRLEAIKIAEPAAKSRTAGVRAVAVEAIIDAHLGAAQDVAWGHWKQKQTAAAEWLSRASTLAAEALKSGDLPAGQRLKISQKVLAAYAGLEGKIDPAPQAEQTIRVARMLIDGTDDPLRKQRYAWEAGVALYDALQTEHARGDIDAALKHGAIAATFFEQASKGRQLVERERFVLGRLYFRLGSLHAVERKRHQDAVVWFDKATPLLLSDFPHSTPAEMGSRGESLVSIGVTLWALGRQEDALQVTTIGSQLIEQAVEEGALETDALRIPYANLATMHRHMGDAVSAKSFEEMAATARSTLSR